MQKSNVLNEQLMGEALLKFQTQKIEENYPFSEVYNKNFIPKKSTEEKILKLIKKSQKSYYKLINTVGKRVAVAVLIVFIGLTTTVFGVEALRESFVDFIVETYEKFSSVRFEDKTLYLAEELSDSTETVPQNPPTYLPEGYNFKCSFEDYFEYRFIYQNSKGETLTVEQFIAKGTNKGINTENATIEKIYINDVEALYYENKSYRHILFKYNKCGYFITGVVSKEEMIEIAKSINLE